MSARLKALGILALIVGGITLGVLNVGHEQDKVEQALIAHGYQNASAHSHMFVACWGAKNRYGYKWTATKNGQRVEGEACSGGLFQDTVIKP